MNQGNSNHEKLDHEKLDQENLDQEEILIYPTVTNHIMVGDGNFQVTTIRNLDEAIDILCHKLNGQADIFAEDQCPYYGIIWPSGRALAEYLATVNNLPGKILEIGCGVGLPSFVCTQKGFDIIASDSHPDVELLFRHNCEKNNLSPNYFRMNWITPPQEFHQNFKIILGSDILYEGRHAQDVARALTLLVKPDGEIWIADPGRGYLQTFLDEMTQLGWQETLIPWKLKDCEIYILKFKRTFP